MSRNKTVVFDLDDTLCEFTDGFQRFMCFHMDRPYTPFNYDGKYELMGQFKDSGLNADQALTLYERSGLMSNQRPVNAMVNRYMSHGALGQWLVVLTARGWMDQPFKEIRSLFSRWGIRAPDEIIVCPLTATKADIVADMKADVCTIYDDNAKQLISYLKYNPKRAEIIAIDRPWNQHVKGVNRIYV